MNDDSLYRIEAMDDSRNLDNECSTLRENGLNTGEYLGERIKFTQTPFK